jgi:hypothetical protein
MVAYAQEKKQLVLIEKYLTERGYGLKAHWSGKVLLDWQPFSTPEEAKASARQLVCQGETYVIEEHDEACPRCEATMNVKSMHNTFNEASA